MSPNDSFRPEHTKGVPRTEPTLARFEAFDIITERAAISILKFAGWIATVVVVLYGLWKSL
jgi:hypothetical protein